MYSLDSLGLFRLFVRGRAVYLHGLATAGAMLTCAAVVLNVGPFGKMPKIDSLSDKVIREVAQETTEQPFGWTSMSGEIEARSQPDSPQSTMGAANVAEPIRPLTEPTSSSVIEVAASAPQPVSPKEAGAEISSTPPREELAAAAPAPAAQPPTDAKPDLMKRATIVGVWAPDAGTCSAQEFREGTLPAVINADGAWAGETFCVFTSKKQTETGWSVVAKCSNPRGHWTTNVRLTVHENRLTWASKRGTQIYTRCAPDVLMAEAR